MVALLGRSAAFHYSRAMVNGLCLGCGAELMQQGRRLTCARCGSAMIETDELADMLLTMAPDGEDLAGLVRPRAGESRPCPRCGAAMAPRALNQVPVDACAEHGIWFDAKELARALERTGDAFADREIESSMPGYLSPSDMKMAFAQRKFWNWLFAPRRPRDLD